MSFFKGFPFARDMDPFARGILLQGNALGKGKLPSTFSIYTANSCFEWLENLKQLQRRCTCMYMAGSCVACNMLHLDTPHIWMLVFDHFAVPVMTAKHFLGLCYLKKPFARLQNILCKVLYKPFARGNLLQGKVLLQGAILLQGLPFARLFMKKAWGKVCSTLFCI